MSILIVMSVYCFFKLFILVYQSHMQNTKNNTRKLVSKKCFVYNIFVFSFVSPENGILRSSFFHECNPVGIKLNHKQQSATIATVKA